MLQSPSRRASRTMLAQVMLRHVMSEHDIGNYELLSLLVRVQIRLHNVAQQALLAEHELPLTHFEVLRCVATTEDCRVGTVSSRLAITVGSASRSVDALESRQLVQRSPNPNNRRSSFLHATKTGTALVRSASRFLDAGLDRWFAELTPTMRAQVGKSLVKVLRELEAAGAGQPIG